MDFASAGVVIWLIDNSRFESLRFRRAPFAIPRTLPLAACHAKTSRVRDAGFAESRTLANGLKSGRRPLRRRIHPQVDGAFLSLTPLRDPCLPDRRAATHQAGLPCECYR